jgi:hypothetical protein
MYCFHCTFIVTAFSPLFFQFNLQSESILSYSNFEFKSLSNSLESLSDSITLKGLQNTSTEWPYISLPFFEFDTRTEHVTSLSRYDFVCTTPIVEDVAAWNVFNEAVFHASNKPFNPYMFKYDEDGKLPANGTGPFLPIHHVYTEAPLNSDINISINVNNYEASSDPGFAKVTTVISNVQHAAISGLLSLTYFRDSYPEIFDATEPMSMFVKPIFSTLEEGTSEIVGYVQSLIEWKYFLSGFNANGAGNIVCVVENSCGDLFSFILSEKSIQYVSDEDAHVHKFDDIKATSVIGVDDVPNGDVEKAKSAGVCIYTLTIYPTIEFRKEFNSNAVLYTVVIGVTMIIMVGAFFAYDS